MDPEFLRTEKKARRRAAHMHFSVLLQSAFLASPHKVILGFLQSLWYALFSGSSEKCNILQQLQETRTQIHTHTRQQELCSTS